MRQEAAEEINRKLSYYISQAKNNEQKKLKIDEKHIVNDDDFLSLIDGARNKLGIEDKWLDNESELEDWIATTMSGKPLDEIPKYSDEYYDYIERLYHEAREIISQLRLPYGWQEYVATAIAIQEKPTEAYVEVEPYIVVEEVLDDALIVRIEKGLRPEEYRVAWKAFVDFLKQPNSYKQYSDKLKNRIFADHKKGLSDKEIAHKYFPDEPYTSITVERIKKIISRKKASINTRDKKS